MKGDSKVRENRDVKEEEEEKKSVQKFDSIEESYLYWRNYLPETPYQEYLAKKKCVSLGKELLKIEVTKKKIKNEETGEEEEEETVYDRACEALKKARPAKREIGFASKDIDGKKYPIYNLSAKDAGDCHAESERLDYVRIDFKNQQYEYIIGELQEVDDEIFHELVKSKMIPLESITPKKIIDRTLRESGFDVLFEEDIPQPKKEQKDKKKEKK